MEQSAGDIINFYRVDSRDRICEVSGTWDEFAVGNDGGRAVAANIVGTSLFNHVSGDVSRMYVRAVFEGVRVLGRPVTRPYRCDSPGVKRFMEMIVTLESNGALRVEHRLLHTDTIVKPVSFVPGKTKGPSTRTRCSMCNRVKIGTNWCDVGGPIDSDVTEYPMAVVYGVCSSCLAGIRQLGSLS